MSGAGIGAAAAMALGGIGESIISGFGQSSANRSNTRLSREQMAWQERMSSTAHQRSVQDMRSAGLNPLYYSGHAASTPSGSHADMKNVAEGVKGTSARVADAAIRGREGRALDSQIAVNTASANEIAARTRLLGLKTPEQELYFKMYDIANKIVDQFLAKATGGGSKQNLLNALLPGESKEAAAEREANHPPITWEWDANQKDIPKSDSKNTHVRREK